VTAELPLSAAGEAHTAMREGRNVGKTLLAVNPPRR
jgi:hypothetical protein